MEAQKDSKAAAQPPMRLTRKAHPRGPSCTPIRGAVSTPIDSQVRGCLYGGGQRFKSLQLHQVVCTSWHDFLRHRIVRHSRGLRRQQSVCWVFRPSPWLIGGVCGRKSLAANFRFQGCCLPHVHRARFRTAAGFEPRHSTGSGWMDQPLAERQTGKNE
jgi:hypothetical protein